MSFEDALGATDVALFNPYGLKECYHDIALRGCLLSRKDDDTVFDVRDGITYALSLSFNKHGKLTDVILQYSRDGEISADECEGLFARTADWVAKDYGPLLRVPTSAAGETAAERRSPGGIAYPRWRGTDGNQIMGILYTDTGRLKAGQKEGGQERTWDRRAANVFATYFVIRSQPTCMVDVQFSEPSAIERRAEEPTKAPRHASAAS